MPSHARDVETLARRLNGLPPQPSRETVAIAACLESARQLLERAVHRKPEPSPQSELPKRDAEPPAEALEEKLFQRLIAVVDYAYSVMAEGDATEARIGRAIFDRVASALGDAGIEVLNGSGAFAVETQQVVQTTRTDDPARDRLVQSTIRVGYRRGKQILRPQQVVVYRTE